MTHRNEWFWMTLNWNTDSINRFITEKSKYQRNWIILFYSSLWLLFNGKYLFCILLKPSYKLYFIQYVQGLTPRGQPKCVLCTIGVATSCLVAFFFFRTMCPWSLIPWFPRWESCVYFQRIFFFHNYNQKCHSPASSFVPEDGNSEGTS